MKILFASDMSFNYMASFPGREAARETMREAAGVFRTADFSVVGLANNHTKDYGEGPRYREVA